MRGGFSVVAVSNGAAAIEAMGERLPAVALICDRLPDVTNQEICRLIKAHPEIRMLRITTVTDGPELSGADAWIRSAASPDELAAYAGVLSRLSRAEQRIQELETYPLAGCPAGMAAHPTQWIEGRHPFGCGNEVDQAADVPHPPVQYQRLVDLAPEPIGVHLDDKLVYVNPAFLELVGVSEHGEVLGHSPLEFIHPDDHAVARERIQSMLAAGRPVRSAEERFVRRDGTAVPVEVAATLCDSDRGQAILMFVRDITRQQQVEESLRLREHELRLIMDSAPALISYIDSGYRYRNVNKSYQRQFGIAPEDVQGCHVREVLGDAAWTVVKPYMQRALAGEPIAFEQKIPYSRGGTRWMFVTYTPDRDEAGNVRGFVAQVLDITSRKAAETNLLESEQRFRQIAQTISHVFWMTELNPERVLYVSPAFRDIWGRAPEELYANPRLWVEAIHPEDRAAVAHAFENWIAAAGGGDYDIEFRILRPDGELRWISDRGTLVRDAAGRVYRITGIAEDITERKQAEEEIARLNQDLERRLHELETIFATVPIGLAIAEDPEGRRIRGNPANERMLGLSAGSKLSTAAPRPAPIRVFEKGSELPVERLPMQRAVRGETVAGLVLDVVRPDGNTATLFSTATPLFDEQGRPRGAVGAFLDVTPLQRAEEALRVSESRFRAMIQAVPSLTFEGDASGNNTFASESWYRFTGMTVRETSGRGWAQAVHPEDRPAVAQRWTEAMRAGTLYESKHRIRRADGSYRWFIARALPSRNADGVIERWTGSLTDIDDLIQRESALHESEGRIRHTLESLPLLVWTCRPDGRCDYLSPQWLRYTGLPEQARLGRQWLRQVHDDDRPQVIRQWREAAATGVMFEAELRIRRADGAYHWFQSRAVPLRNEEGRIVKWLGTGSDIEDLKRAVQALREADRRKDEFLAMLSHELRNPLAPIRSATAVLRRLGQQDPELQAARDIIARQVDHMTLLIEDLLDVSRIMRGQIALKKAVLSIADVVEQGVEASLPVIESRRHRLTVTMPPQAVQVEGDLVRLVQVVTNLLRNAAKYTDESGEIRLTVEIDDRSILLRVSDNGMGMAADLLPRVFEVFTQGPRALDRSQGGLGIGLSLAKQLVEMHGGTIEARSDGLGQGSEFTVRLPRLAWIRPSFPPEASPLPPPSAAPLDAKRILVVDDNRDAAQALALLLTLEGHQVRAAHDGPAAIETARVFHPQVVLLDIGLPGMDGFEVAERLRSCPEAHDAVLVAISGYAEPDILRRSSEAGFRRHLVKPVETDDLLDVLTRCSAERDDG